MAAYRYVEENGLATMLATKRLAGLTREVNLREYVTHTPPGLPTLALKPRGDITRSPKQGYQWPHKKLKEKRFATWKYNTIIYKYQINFQLSISILEKIFAQSSYIAIFHTVRKE